MYIYPKAVELSSTLLDGEGYIFEILKGDRSTTVTGHPNHLYTTHEQWSSFEPILLQHSICPHTADMEEFVPGTIYLVDMNHRHGHEGGPTLGKDGIGIELHPKPSNNPEDPLNWSKQRKINSLIATNVYTFAVALVTALQYPLFASMTEDVGISTSDLVQGCGVMFLLLGFGCLFWQPVAMTYGRRGVYLVSLLGTIPCSEFPIH